MLLLDNAMKQKVISSERLKGLKDSDKLVKTKKSSIIIITKLIKILYDQEIKKRLNY